MNGGRCINTVSGYACSCPFGQFGGHCEETIEINKPAFTGMSSPTSYFSIPPPKHILRSLRLGFKFKAAAKDGSGIVKV